MSKFSLAKERPITDFLNINEECECGKTHALSTSLLYCYAGATEKIDEILQITCPIGKILIITQDSVKDIADNLRDKITQKPVIWRVLEDNIEVSEEIIKSLPMLAEDVKCIIAVGGGTVSDVAKIYAKTASAQLISVPTALSFTNIFSESVEVMDRFILKSVKGKSPYGVIVDLDVIADSPKSLKGAGFGLAMAEYLTVFEMNVRNAYLKEGVCKNLTDMLITAVDNLCQLAEKRSHNKADLENYAKNFLKLSMAKALLGKEERTGADNLYLAAKLMEKAGNVYSKTQISEYGSKVFELFLKVVKLYKLFFSSVLAEGLPPDMDYRYEILLNDLNIPDEAAYRLTSTMISPALYAMIRKKTSEQRYYFKQGIDSIDSRLPLFISAYGELSEVADSYYEKEWLKKAIVCSTEINGTFTGLAVMKYNGVLERYE